MVTVIFPSRKGSTHILLRSLTNNRAFDTIKMKCIILNVLEMYAHRRLLQMSALIYSLSSLIVVKSHGFLLVTQISCLTNLSKGLGLGLAILP